MKELVVFSGAGMSAESGLNTFRDNMGLWENHRIEDVATPQAWAKDPEQVLRFYNQRRKQLNNAKPNKAHLAIAKLEEKYVVKVITQNVDDLHERAGSSEVIHLHGELKKARSTKNPDLIHSIESDELKLGDFCELGSQLRPHVVWFGEEVPNMQIAYNIISKADILLVIGTSLNVYPAAGLLDFVPKAAKKFLIDPNAPSISKELDFNIIGETAERGMEFLISNIL